MEERHFAFGPFRVDARERVVSRDDVPVALTPKAFETLVALLRRRGQLVTKDTLLREVWPDTFVEESSLAFNISSLRKALGRDERGDAYIETVPRHGYRFRADVGSRTDLVGSPRRHTVGRAAERAALSRAIEEARAGPGRLVCVTGEAGIGKTTLIDDVLRDVSNGPRACRVGRGQCSERLAGTGAYLPLLETLKTLCEDPTEPDVRHALVTQAPSWAAQLGLPDEEAARPGLDAAVPSQERLKWELAGFVERIAGQQGLVLFFDDLQWADASTIDLLAYLAGRFDRLPVLVLAAYRSSEMRLTQHPFLAIQLDLQGRGRCHELELSLLTRDDVDAYVALELPGHALPQSVPDLIHARTEGNALFMVDLVRYLRERALLVRVDETWHLAGPLTVLERELPESTRSVIRQTIDRLDPRDQRLLATASVAGAEFLCTVVARVASLDGLEAEDRLDVLERVHGLVARVREQDLPDGTPSVRYRFVHALYHEAFYNTLTTGRRRLVSGAIAEALEQHFGPGHQEIAAEVAPLYSHARRFDAAATWFLVAAERALRVCAHQEALTLARRGLEACGAAASGSAQQGPALRFHTIEGLAAQAVQGFAGPDVERAYRQALVLARSGGRSDELFTALLGLWLCYEIRADLQAALDVARELVTIAEASDEQSQLVQAYQAIGGTLMDRGDFADAATYLDRAIVHVDRSGVEYPATVIHPGVACRAWAARVAWPLGYPDRALQHAQAAVVLAHEIATPQSLALALTFAAIVHHLRGEAAETLARAEEAVSLSHERGVTQTLAFASMWRGWALVALGQAEQGLPMLVDGLATARTIGSEIARPHFLGLLAEAYGACGRIEDGLALLREAELSVERTGERYCEPEIHRIRGCLLLKSADATAAEAAIREALRAARQQGARGWELRAALALARLPGHRAATEGREALVALCDAFGEGWTTADLRAARAVTDAHPSGGAQG